MLDISSAQLRKCLIGFDQYVVDVAYNRQRLVLLSGWCLRNQIVHSQWSGRLYIPYPWSSLVLEGQMSCKHDSVELVMPLPWQCEISIKTCLPLHISRTLRPMSNRVPSICQVKARSDAWVTYNIGRASNATSPRRTWSWRGRVNAWQHIALCLWSQPPLKREDVPTLRVKWSWKTKMTVRLISRSSYTVDMVWKEFLMNIRRQCHTENAMKQRWNDWWYL